MARSPKDPWNMSSVMEPHYKALKMPSPSQTQVVYTPAAKKRMVADARSRTGYGRRP